MPTGARGVSGTRVAMRRASAANTNGARMIARQESRSTKVS
jgi:hypothetical protein